MDFCEMLDAANVIVKERANFRNARLAQHHQMDFHERSIARRALLIEQAILLSFFEQRLAADAQNFGGAADFVARGLESGTNRIALELLQRAQSGKRAASTVGSLQNRR